MTQFLTRRESLQGGAILGGGLLAGCLGDDDADDDGQIPETDDDTDNDPSDDDDTDDQETPGSEGMVYAFGPSRIAVIDPTEGEIVDEITDGIDDDSWGDTQIVSDYSAIYAIRESPSQVVVIDTASRSIAAEIDIGPGPTHVYHPNEEEIWAHGDDEGAFYVIDTALHEVAEIVQSGMDDEGHGKLLYHSDFGDTGYATNVNDPGLPVIDLAAYERTDFIELTDEGGTHYKAYSPENGCLYAELSGPNETAVLDPDTHDTIDTLPYAGGMYLSPDESTMAFIDGDDVIFINVTDTEHEELASVSIEGGGPDVVRYDEAGDGTLYAFTANTMDNKAAVIDVDAGQVIDELDVGDIVRPEDAHHLHRSGVSGDQYFITPADADATVTIIDMSEQAVAATVAVEEGVDTVQYVGDSGTGYSGKLR